MNAGHSDGLIDAVVTRFADAVDTSGRVPEPGMGLPQGNWSEFADRLIDLWKRTSQVDADGIESPSADALATVTKIFGRLRTSPFGAPRKTASDGEGGILLEWSSAAERQKGWHLWILIEKSGDFQMRLYNGKVLAFQMPESK